MIWENSVITKKGIALQGKFTQLGQAVGLTRAAVGNGKTPSHELINLNALPNEIKDIPIQGIRMEVYTAIISVLLDNIGTSSSYNINQVGFYATDPDEGEILYAVAQADAPKKIPSETESPGYSIEWNFHFTLTNEINVTIEVNPSSFITGGMIGKPGGIPPLNDQGKIPDQYLPGGIDPGDIKASKIKYYETTFEKSAWTELPENESNAYASYVQEKTFAETDAEVCNVLFDRESITHAIDAGVMSVTEFENGKLKIFSEFVPEQDLTATVELIKGAW